MRGNRLLQASAALFLALFPAAMTTAQDVDWSQGTGWPPYPNLQAVAVDPEAPTTIWAGGTQGPGLFRSVDDGRSWLAFDGPDAPRGVGEIAIDSTNGGAVYAALDHIFRSDDGGQHWTMFAGPGQDEGWFSFAKVNALAVDPNESGRLWAATSEGVSRSDDRGQTWSDAGGLAKEVYRLLVDKHLGTLYASSYDREYLTDSPYYPQPYPTRDGGPIYVSTNGGESWVQSADLPYPVLSFALDPFQAGTVYAGTLGAFLRSTNSGASWETLFASSPEGPADEWYWFFSIVPDPVRRNRLYAGTSYGVVSSSDGGRSWLPFSRGLPVGEFLALAVSPDGRRLHAATYEGVFELDLAGNFPCTPSALRLCLVGGRYAVELDARRGEMAWTPGTARPLGDRAGYFSLPFVTGDPDLPEVLVKMVDPGSGGGAWVFHGSLTSLPYVLTVTDTTTGQVETYESDAQNPLCGGADTAAFLTDGSSPWDYSIWEGAAAGVQPQNGALSLLGGRFSATLSASNPRNSRTESGAAVAMTDRFGYFSLPGITGDPTFPEVAVKMIDFSSVDGRFWVFSTGLTNLDYTLSVTDSVTGAVRVYESAAPFCGTADTNAFTSPTSSQEEER